MSTLLLVLLFRCSEHHKWVDPTEPHRYRHQHVREYAAKGVLV